MKRMYRYPVVMLTAVLALAGSAMFAQAEDNSSQNNGTTTTTTQENGTTTTVTQDNGSPVGVTTVTVQPTTTQATLSGKISGLNFASKSFWINDANGRSVAVFIENAPIKYNGDDANIYRMMGSPQVTVDGMITAGDVLAPGGNMHANSITINSGPTVRLQPSSYTEQAQPAFGQNELVRGFSGTPTTQPTVTGTPDNQTTTASGHGYSSSQPYATKRHGYSSSKSQHNIQHNNK